MNRKSEKWTDEEINFLFENAGTMSREEMAHALGRTTSGVRTMCSKKKVGSLQSNSAYLCATEACNYLGITRSYFWKEVHKGRIKPIKKRNGSKIICLYPEERLIEYRQKHPKRTNYKVYGKYEIATIKGMLEQGFTNAEIANKLGRFPSSVGVKVHQILRGEI